MTPNQLKTAREKLKLTKTQMAKVLEFGSYRAYQHLEAGKQDVNPRVAKLIRALLVIANTDFATDFGLIKNNN